MIGCTQGTISFYFLRSSLTSSLSQVFPQPFISSVLAHPSALHAHAPETRHPPRLHRDAHENYTLHTLHTSNCPKEGHRSVVFRHALGEPHARHHPTHVSISLPNISGTRLASIGITLKSTERWIDMFSSSWDCAAAPSVLLACIVANCNSRTTADSSSLPPLFPQTAPSHLIMATLRLLTLCAIVSTALSFVAMGPPSRHTAAATTRPTFTTWGSRGRTSQVGTLAAGTLLSSGWVCVVLCVMCFSVCQRACWWAWAAWLTGVDCGGGAARSRGVIACMHLLLPTSLKAPPCRP